VTWKLLRDKDDDDYSETSTLLYDALSINQTINQLISHLLRQKKRIKIKALKINAQYQYY